MYVCISAPLETRAAGSCRHEGTTYTCVYIYIYTERERERSNEISRVWVAKLCQKGQPWLLAARPFGVWVRNSPRVHDARTSTGLSLRKLGAQMRSGSIHFCCVCASAGVDSSPAVPGLGRRIDQCRSRARRAQRRFCRVPRRGVRRSVED